jgi:DNA transformation protein and related proteins
MPSSSQIVDFIAGQMAGAGMIKTRAMFGEFTLYCDGKVIALVCDDQLYLKPNDAAISMLENPQYAPAYSGAKPSLLISEDLWDDAEILSELARVTAEAMPPPKLKKVT